MWMTALTLFRKNLVASASRLGNINDFTLFPKNETLLADGYIKAKEDEDEVLKDAYLAALMLRHWKDIRKLFLKCRTCDSMNDISDFSAIIWERIEYACKYKAWQREGSKLNAQQCINMAIATEVKNQMYFSNLDKNRANANTDSLDRVINAGHDDRETTLAETVASDERVGYTKVDFVIQTYLSENKIIEAIVIDTIANGDTVKANVETIKTKDENGNEITIKSKTNEFWRYRTAQLLMNIPEEYKINFEKRFKVAAEHLKEAFDQIQTAKNQKIYKFVDNTLLDLRKHPELIANIQG